MISSWYTTAKIEIERLRTLTMRLQCSRHHKYDTSIGKAYSLRLGSPCPMCGDTLQEVRMPPMPSQELERDLSPTGDLQEKENERQSNTNPIGGYDARYKGFARFGTSDNDRYADQRRLERERRIERDAVRNDIERIAREATACATSIAAAGGYPLPDQLACEPGDAPT